MNLTNRILSLTLGAAAVFAQNAPLPTFEVASIRPTSLTPQEGVTAGVRIDGLQVRCGALTLKDYIGIAYRVKVYQISGPEWLGTDRFDIVATLPSESAAALLPDLIRRLLEERFEVKIHREQKEFPVYALEVASGGLKMQETPPDPNADPKPSVNVTGTGGGQGVSMNLGGGSSYTFANNRLEAKRLNMAALTGNLERFVDRPMIDQTNLKGSYDFALDVTPEDYRAMLIRAGVNAGVRLPPEVLRFLDAPSLGSLFEGLQKLGLKLESRKAPLEVIVIDGARKTPTEN